MDFQGTSNNVKKYWKGIKQNYSYFGILKLKTKILKTVKY